MKIVVFTIQYTVSDFGWEQDPVPVELRSNIRMPLFYELIKYARYQQAKLAVLPGGFFRVDRSGGIANTLRHCPPRITVLVGRDNEKCNYREGWVIASNGTINRRIPQAWISPNKFSKDVLRNTERRFQINNKMYSIFCCGDVIIYKKKIPTYTEAAFVLAHYSATGRNFTPSMRKLDIPTFLSHHVKYPYNTDNFAYNGKKKIYPVKKAIKGEFKGLKSKKLKWIARVYSV